MATRTFPSQHLTFGVMFVDDGQYQGANQTKHIDFFYRSTMLIPVNVEQKHWVLAGIDLDDKRISWYNSVGVITQQNLILCLSGFKGSIHQTLIQIT